MLRRRLLRVGRAGLGVVFDVRLGCFRRVMRCMRVMAVGQVRVVPCQFVAAGAARCWCVASMDQGGWPSCRFR